MPKPTLIQSLLGRPSQSYAFPPQKDYHSTKQDLIRAATGRTSSEEQHVNAPDHTQSHRNTTSEHVSPTSSSAFSRVRRLRGPPYASSSSVTLDGTPELLPNRSFIRHAAAPNSSRQKHELVDHAVSEHDHIYLRHPRSHPSTDRVPAVGLAVVQHDVVDRPLSEPSTDDESDVFYTPGSSGVPSAGNSPADDVMLLEPQALASALLPLHAHGRSSNLKSPLAPPELSSGDYFDVHHTAVTPGLMSLTPSDLEPPLTAVSRTPSDDSRSSSYSPSPSACTSAGTSAAEPDATSLFDCGATSSTRVTTPAASEGGPPKSDEDNSAKIIVISTPIARKPRPHSIDLSGTSFIPPVLPSAERAKRRQSQPIPPPRTDEDWAKDVLWLSPPTGIPPLVSLPQPGTPSGSPRRRSRILHPDLLPPVPPVPTPMSTLPLLPAPHQLDRNLFPDIPTIPVTAPMLPTPYLLDRQAYSEIPTIATAPVPVRPRKEHRNSRHSARRSRTRMSALWEEDESEYSSEFGGASSAEVSRASTPAPGQFADEYLSVWTSTPPTECSFVGVGAGGGNGPLHTQLKADNNPYARLQHKASVSESELVRLRSFPNLHSDSQPPSPSAESPDARLNGYAQRRVRARSVSFSSSSTPVFGVHPIPAPLESSGLGINNGYTGLTLPHANWTPGKSSVKPLPDGKVDLVRSGQAQSSMATIEVVRGVAESFSTSALSRTRRSLSRSFSIGKSKRRRNKDSPTPAHLRGALPLPVAFTAHIPPPSFVPPSSVLVRVFAVGLDGLDSLLVQDKAEQKSLGGGGSIGRKGKRLGFVPGRSFAGKVLECGFEVNRDVCRRGEWVMGLLDVRKSGALAEFILVERHRVVRSPNPQSRTTVLSPPRRRSQVSIRAHSLPSSSTAPAIAARSSPLASPPPLSIEELSLIPLCGIPAHRAVRSFNDVLSSRSRKAGAKPRILILMGHDGPGAMTLQLLSKRARVCAQVPESAANVGGEKQGDAEVDSPEQAIRREKIVLRLKGWGAEDVLFGEPLNVLERLLEDTRSFDGVLDTVGGVAVWEASQRLLANSPSAVASQSVPVLSSMSPSTDASEGEEGRKKPKDGPSVAQFTTLVGDMPLRAVPTAQDNLRSGLRSLRRAMSTTSVSAKGSASSSSGRVFGSGGKGKVKRTVGYTWLSIAADVDEGEGTRDSLAAIAALVEDGKVRPWVPHGEDEEDVHVVTFENAPEVFRRDAVGPRGALKDGGTCVVKIASS